MAHRNVGRSIPYFKIEQVGCHRESPNGSFTQNILSLAKPILPDFACAVITPICEIGVGIGIQRLRKFLTVNYIVTAIVLDRRSGGATQEATTIAIEKGL